MSRYFVQEVYGKRFSGVNPYKNESDRRLITNGHCSEILTYALSHKCKIGGTLQFKLL